LEKAGDEIRRIELPGAVTEQGLDEGQLLLLKLAVFGTRFREKEGGLYGRNVVDVELLRQGNGVWTGEVLVPAMGNVTLEVVGQGVIDGLPWRRTATQAVHLPQGAVTTTKLRIDDIIARRNKLWGHTIVGAIVRTADGAIATPADGIVVDAHLVQGQQQAASGPMPFYRRGGYYIWRFKSAGFRPGPSTVTTRVAVDGAIVTTSSKQIDL
jgi:hypothetical protein